MHVIGYSEADMAIRRSQRIFSSHLRGGEQSSEDPRCFGHELADVDCVRNLSRVLCQSCCLPHWTDRMETANWICFHSCRAFGHWNLVLP